MQDAQEPLLYRQNDSIAWVTLNRPQVLNALDDSLTQALVERIHAIEFDPSVRCVVLSGNGAGFMAGGDIGFFGKTLKMSPQERQAAFHTYIQRIHPVIVSLKRMPKPVIASVHGATAGFGVSLMLACDVTIAAENSVFTMAYGQMGLSPDGGSSFSLPRILGTRKAMELVLLGDKISSDLAQKYGLVNWVVKDDVLKEETAKLAQKLAQGPTQAYGLTKQLLNNSFDRSLSEQLLAEEEAFARCTATQDFSHGAISFLEKKAPEFKGY